MSHQPAVTTPFAELKTSTQAALLRIARRIEGGFAGEVTLQIAPNGGVQRVTWVQIETGDVLKEHNGLG